MSLDKDNNMVNVELHFGQGVTATALKEEHARVDLDTILKNEVGQFGPFQVRMLVLSAIAAVLHASNSEYVFTSARIRTRCLVPECEDRYSSEFAPAWLASALPPSGDSFDGCFRFDNVTLGVGVGVGVGVGAPSNDSCPAEFFDRNTTLPCEEFVYENTHTVVYDFELSCEEWRRSLIGTVRTLGTFFALPLTGFVSDRWGRKLALTLNAFNCGWIGLTRYWANNYSTFVALEFLESVFGYSVFSCTYILVLETVGPKYRVIAGGTLTSCFALGQVCLGLIAWALPYWRDLTLAVFAPQLLTFSYFWILTESVRWYLNKGRYEESEALLKKAAKINKTHLSEKSLQLLRATAEEDKKMKAIEETEKALEPCLPVLVFKHKQILLRCLILPLCWISTTLAYYGLSINSVTISGNKYINYIVVAAVEIPGFMMSVYLLGKIGRKPVLMGGFYICAACQAAYVFMTSGNTYSYSLAVYLVGKCSISAVATAIYVYTTEVFPTKYRHSLFAFSSMIGRIGSMVAPLTPAMGAATFASMPFVLFGSFALLSGSLILLTPETLGAKLPDTMEEAESMHKKRTS